ncbi:Crp/Fnr family transcriptional regulator [Bradyrhizobium sp.]|uniref:Crp/Fnr family transcriptional regulator n=1 Tax=Bradyrhizobium sp. TaxID=376 RepID=UPI003C39C16B
MKTPGATNLILDSLSASDGAVLGAHLRPVKLIHKQVLFDIGDLARRVYFPTTGVISLVLGLSTGEFVETAMVGREGVIGASSALDGKVSLNRAIVQLSGDAMECQAEVLANAAYGSRPLMSALIRHEETVLAQAQQTVACMAAHDTQARLCCWLLRARDLARSDSLPFTQEFLAEMLGVKRTSISPIAHTLQQAGMIRYARGRIAITNAEGLEGRACECYRAARMNYIKP